MIDSTISITFWLDGRPYAMRRWYQVPRVGETVMLNPEVSQRPRILTEYRVTRVVWGTEEKDNPPWQCAEIDIEKIERKALVKPKRKAGGK